MRARLTTVVAALLSWAATDVAAHEGHDHADADHGLDDNDPTASPPSYAVDDVAQEDSGGTVENEALPTEAPPPAEPEPLVPPPAPTGDTALDRVQAIPDTTWRQSARDQTPTASRWLEPKHFYFEIRFGPYWPQVDDEPGLTGTPYADYFGTNPKFYFGLEIDWLPIYLPYVASIGPGFGWGYTSSSGNTRLEANPEDEAESETSLDIFPMHVSAVVRFDGLLREEGIPIVPYGKIGLGWGLWSISAPDDNTVDGVSAEGSSLGIHAAAGGAIALNAFDPSGATAMEEVTGIRYAYLYGEWMGDFLGSVGREGQMRVGTSTVVVGLALEF